MSSSPFVINNHPYHDPSSSCSSLDISSEEDILLHQKSSRKQCVSVADEKKDPMYCSQRSKNNLSAKRSRVKRRMNDLVLESKLTQLTNANEILRAKIEMLTRKFGPENEQLKPTVLNILDRSSGQTNQSDNDPLVITTEQISVNKLHFQLLNITSDS